MPTTPQDRKPPARRTPADTEALAAEVTHAAAPDGLDLLQPMHALKRRTRAALLKAYGDLMRGVAKLDTERLDSLGEELQNVDERDLDKVAALLDDAVQGAELSAQVQDVLAVAALDVEEWTAWAESHDDNALFAVFNAYAASMGEAQASPS